MSDPTVRHQPDPRDRGRSGRSLPGRLKRTAALLITSLTLLAACGDDEPPELTIEERLAAVEGRTLTAIEVDEKIALGQTLCRMDEPILDAVWFRLDDEQLEYQDVVFGHLCPERSIFYAGRTGRFVTEEAENSGVVTSTSRPVAPTTTSTGPTSSGRATIAPAPTDSSGSVSSPTTPQPTTTSATTGPTSSQTVSSIQTASTNPGEGG